MKKRVYDYYLEELEYLRDMGPRFAETQPEIASLLDFRARPEEDPFVRRLVEAFAFLTARIRLKLDDDFPKISEAVLEQLLPFVLRPIPAFAIAQLRTSDEKSQTDEKSHLPRHSLFEVRGKKNVLFSNCFAMDSWPISFPEASYRSAPFETPEEVRLATPQSRLQLEIATINEELPFSDLQVDQLVVYVNNQHYGFSIHELLVNTSHNWVGASIEDPVSKKTIWLDRDFIQADGFSPEQTLLPGNQTGVFGHQLVAEYFLLPQKHLFLKLGLRELQQFDCSRVRLNIYFNKSRGELEQQIDTNTFLLGCTPVTNLFPSGKFEIPFDHAQSTYHVLPEEKNPNRLEVYTVESVTAVGPNHSQVDYTPFFAIGQTADSKDRQYWHTERIEWPGDSTRGSLLKICLMNTTLQADELSQFYALILETLVCNRELFDLKKARTQLGLHHELLMDSYNEVEGAFSEGRFVTSFTEAIPAKLDSELNQKVIAHLNLNYLSIQETTLKGILTDLELRDSAFNKELIALITDVRVESCVERVNDVVATRQENPPPVDQSGDVMSYLNRNSVSVCRGVRIEIRVDKAKIEDTAWFQLMSVLDHFFVHLTTINSFTKLVIVSERDDAVLAEFAPRCGRNHLI